MYALFMFVLQLFRYALRFLLWLVKIPFRIAAWVFRDWKHNDDIVKQNASAAETAARTAPDGSMLHYCPSCRSYAPRSYRETYQTADSDGVAQVTPVLTAYCSACGAVAPVR